jgi:iron complex outermembrane receptor protein
VASNFETPTLNELSANPSNLGGFNPDLKPQESVNAEAGVKMRISPKINFDVALFQIDLQNELVAYQLASAPGRTFFRNAGKSRRKGLELALNARISKGLMLNLNYTYSDFRYEDYTVQGTRFDGNRQPAQPRTLAFGALQWGHSSGFYAVAQVQYQSSLYVSDLNTLKAPGHTLCALRSGFTLKRKKGQIEPFAGANNIFHTAYYNNILINAVGDRFFEPAADFATFYGGIRVRIGS